MLAVTGFRTTIVEALKLQTGEPVARIHADLADPETDFLLPDGATRFVIAQGVLHGRRIQAMSGAEIAENLAVNFVNVLRLIEQILGQVRDARIVVIGSVSAREGSYDQLYAASKAAVHAFCSWRLVQPPQLLYCVAPTIIADSGMTRRRADYPAVLMRRPTVTADEVAAAVRAALYCEPSELERLNNSIRYLEGEPQK